MCESVYAIVERHERLLLSNTSLLIRLPQQCADIIEDAAHIFQTENDGGKAFLILYY